MTSHQPIHILGAGIAGLTLSRCLATKGIPSILFDKGSSPARHNYGITLHPWAYQPLLKTLNIDESTFCQRLAVDSNSLQGGNGRVSSSKAPYKEDNSSINHARSFRAHCGKFKSLLREGTDVRWKHTFQRISPTTEELIFNDDGDGDSNDGGVRIPRAPLTIDTCGVHSLTRKSLSHASQLTVLPYVVFRGTRTIPAQTFQEIYAPAFNDGRTVIELKKNNLLLQISINDVVHQGNRDGDVNVSYIYSRPAARENDALHRPGREKDEASSITEEFFAEVAQLVGLGLASPFKEMFDVETMRKERILHWLMRSSVTERSDLERLLREEGVVVIGDALHALPVLGGDGANYAVKDAIGLAEILQSGGGGGGAVDGVASFYEDRYDEWKSAVASAEKRLAEMHGSEKSTL